MRGWRKGARNLRPEAKLKRRFTLQGQFGDNIRQGGWGAARVVENRLAERNKVGSGLNQIANAVEFMGIADAGHLKISAHHATRSTIAACGSSLPESAEHQIIDAGFACGHGCVTGLNPPRPTMRFGFRAANAL